MSPATWAEVATQALAPATLAMVSTVAARAGTLLGVRTRTIHWRTAITNLDRIVADVVREFSVRHVEALKSATRDRKLAASTQVLLRAAALATTKRHLGPGGLADLSSALGFTELPLDDGALDAILTTRIEAQLYCGKLRQQSFARLAKRREGKP